MLPQKQKEETPQKKYPQTDKQQKKKEGEPEWSLFQDEGDSFLSRNSSQFGAGLSVQQYQALKGKMQGSSQQQSGNFFHRLPVIYLILSLCVLFFAIISQFQYQKAQTFPLFPELPFQGNSAFTLGVAVISFIGIVIDYFIYSLNQRRPIKQGCYVQRVSYHNFPATVLLCGTLSHFFFFAFALLPADQKQRTPPSALYAEDRVFLTLSFTLNFFFKAYYIFFNSKLRNPYNTITMSYQVKTALFTIISFIFSAFACVNIVSLCLGMTLFQGGEPQISDKTSAAEDFIAYMVGDIYSTLAYYLYIVNSLFVGMYYYDLKMVNNPDILLNIIYRSAYQ